MLEKVISSSQNVFVGFMGNLVQHLLWCLGTRFELYHPALFWGGIGDEHKFHLINYDSVCVLLFKMGGLGIRRLLLFIKPWLESGCGLM